MSSYAKYSSLGEQENPNFNASAVISIKSKEHKQQLCQNNRIVVVDVYGEWCGPCKQIAPRYAEMAQKYNNPGFCLLVNEDVDKDFSDGIRGVPAFQFFVNGQFVETITGADIKGVETKLLQHIQNVQFNQEHSHHIKQIRN